MGKQLQYTGATKLYEFPITGRQAAWMPGEVGWVEDGEAAKLLAAEVGFRPAPVPALIRDGQLIDPAGNVLLGAAIPAADVARVRAARRLSWTTKPAGTFAQSGAGDVTRHLTIALPAPILAFRLRLLGAYGPMTGITAAFAWSANASSLYTPTGSWSGITWGGASSVNVPNTPSGAGATAAATVVESDLMSSASLPVDANVLAAGRNPGSILMLRTYQPTGQQLSRFDLTDVPTFPAAGLASAFQVGADGVTSAAAFNSPSSGAQLMPAELLLYSASDVRTFAHCGASTVSGFGDNTDGIGRGWAWRACNAITGRAVVPANYGYAGQSSAYSLTEAITHLTRTRPTAAAFLPFSPNDSDVGTAAGNARQIAGAIRFLDACRDLRINPVQMTFQAWNGATAQQIASRKAVNDAVRALAAAAGCGLIDVESVLSSGDAWANAAWTSDGLHPNSAGHAVLAAAAQPTIDAATA